MSYFTRLKSSLWDSTFGTAVALVGDALKVNFSNTTIAVTQSTATSLKAQAENYQGGTAVGAANPLQVSLANTASNATAVNVSGTVAVTGVATAANQTNASQKTQVVDGSGNVVGSTGNALDINIKSGNPTTIAVTQGTATNLKAQAECYQGGTAVGSGNPLQVTLANTGVNSTPVTVNGTVTATVDTSSLATSANQTNKSQYVKITDGTYDAEVDSLGYLVNIPIEHHKIHEGEHYIVNHSGTSKNDGQTINLYIKAPNTTSRIHAVFSWASSGAAYGIIQEGSTVTAGSGTAKQIYNRDRNSANASTVLDNELVPVANKASYDVTITGAGTIIHQDYSGAAKSQGGEIRGASEFILDQNAVYVFIVESDAAGLSLNMNVDFYEVD